MKQDFGSEMSNRDLVQCVANGSSEESAAFQILYQRWNASLEGHHYLRSHSDDDKEDILSKCWLKIWRGLPKFNYKSEREFKSWLFKVLKRTVMDHQKRQKRLREKLPLIDLHQKVETSDGDEVELIEVIECPDDGKVLDQEQREFILEIGEKCLSDKQFELLKLRLAGEALPSEWTVTWINTTWHRITAKLVAEINKRKVP